MIDSAADHHRCSCRPGNQRPHRRWSPRRRHQVLKAHTAQQAVQGHRFAWIWPAAESARRSRSADPPRPRHSFRRAGPRRVDVACAGSANLVQPSPVQHISGGHTVGICLCHLDKRRPGNLRAEHRERLSAEEILYREAGATSVRLHCRPADAGRRCELGQHRGEANTQTGARRLVLGVAGDEALSGLGAGVPAAER